VLNVRTGQRSAAFGGVAGADMELRFMAGNADVREGDLLNTSGVDGVYPPGLAVAKVTRVERQADAGFARILLALLSAPDAVRHVLVLEPLKQQLPPRPDEVDAAGAAAAGRAKGGRR
jgi:rod shape-determining protein MreC